MKWRKGAAVIAFFLAWGASGAIVRGDSARPAATRGRLTHVLPSGRIVSPVGTVAGSPNFVTGVAEFGDGVAVLNNGATRTQMVTVYSGKTLRRVAHFIAYKKSGKTPAPGLPSAVLDRQSFFQGLAAGPDNRLYVAGGVSDNVAALALQGGNPRVLRSYPLHWQPFPRNQYPYRYQGRHDGKTRHFYPDAVAVGPRGRHLYVTGMLSNSLARIDLATGRTQYRNIGPYPFALTFADSGRRLVVSLWGGNAVAVVHPATMRLLGTVRVGPPTGPGNMRAGVHPTALAAVPGGPDVLVALANIDRIARVDTRSLKTVGYLDDSPYPGAPPGSYPDGLAVGRWARLPGGLAHPHGQLYNPDGPAAAKGSGASAWQSRPRRHAADTAAGMIFVANAGNNDVAVFDPASGKLLGLIPTGWYPTALTVAHNALYIASAKGLGSGPNIEHQWVGDMMHGLIQKVNLADIPAHLSAWTKEALQNDGFSPAQRTARQDKDGRATAFLRDHIRYVVFILRENKTFDEDFGDYRRAGDWADPHLGLYGERELPNLYHMADRYTLFANFMADGEVTAQGHQWTTAASDSDFVQRTWPEYYSGRGLVANPGWTQSLVPGKATGTGGLPLGIDNPYAIYQNLSALGAWSNPWISYPQRLFLFDDLLEHHVSFEDFGEFVSRSQAGEISSAMKKHLATSFPGWDRMILDTRRANLAIRWLKAHPRSRFPHFLYIWLPDDHTAGRSPCYYTPDYYVADNDLATARFIHYLSTTPEWKQMVVFLTEDDAQSGADHIDAHRTFALAIGPWVKKGHLETQLFSQVNILKTTEAILGLPPLSQWDQNARVFSGIWTEHPDFSPLRVLPGRVGAAFNAGECSDYTLLRREAGAAGHSLTPRWMRWYKKHRTSHGAGLPAPASEESYSPTALLKVEGPEQMKQEWIAARGIRPYEREMAYLKAYAQKRHAPLAAFLGTDRD
ncbi:MAG: bifunctional YncE family protein/alkaline phosphatase family protein [Syntrophobacteraceae bacterium]